MSELTDLHGTVAVVTGGAGGIGRGIVEALLDEGARVVIADIERPVLDQTVADLSPRGEVRGVWTDVSDYDSVEALADEVFQRYGVCNLLFNNAGVTSGGGGKPWEQEANDWRWCFGVNVFGVANGMLAFLPRMLESGAPGVVVNTSSGDGGISPMPAASVYAASKAAVTTLTECLASQLESEQTNLRASIFYPSGGLLRTGLWESDKTRPADLAREVPRKTEAMTVEKLEAQAKAGGYALPWQDLNDLARVVIDGIRDDRFIFMFGLDKMGETLRARADRLEQGQLPIHAKGMLG